MLNTFINCHSDDVPIRIDTARIVSQILLNIFPKFDLAMRMHYTTPSSHFGVIDPSFFVLKYAGGDSERMLGSAIGNIAKGDNNAVHLSIGTKAHPSLPDGLSPVGIRSQLQKSLDALQLTSVGEYYLHQPDTHHSLLDSLITLNELIEEGKIASIGMSNYHVSEVERAFQLCKEYNLPHRPSVYQGLYNPLNRIVEEELLPVLKRYDCAFVAYNPLAGGMLTGKHAMNGEVKDGRFKNNPNYLPRFYTSSNFRALEVIQRACETDGLTMVEAVYRWLTNHSALSEGDGILIGASSLAQLEENLGCCLRARGDVGDGTKQRLSSQVVYAFEEAWKIMKCNGESDGGPFPYWRSYSLDMPGRDSLDQGASYNALKAK